VAFDCLRSSRKKCLDSTSTTLHTLASAHRPQVPNLSSATLAPPARSAVAAAAVLVSGTKGRERPTLGLQKQGGRSKKLEKSFVKIMRRKN
jgi:hypothetical protein